MKVVFTLLALLLSCILPQSLLAQSKKISPDPVARYDAYVQQAVNDWRVPGLTISVVQDGKVLLKKGYGVRELGKPERVDTQTLFAMASTTKAMTAACLGMLVDENKLGWDDLVTNYLPDFQLYDPTVTRELRIRDLLIHNTGVGNADYLWASMQIPSEEILCRMRMVRPSYSFRSGFIYQNIMYLAAGKVIEKASGMPWEKFIRTRIFEPLGMRRTQALFREVTDINRAKPHIEINDTVKLVNSRTEEGLVDAVGPAGSVWSCPDDLTAWMQCMLDSGRYNGKRLLKSTTWAELFKPQTIVTDVQFYPTQQLTKPTWKTYGLGWFQHDYRGRRINFHTGSLTGMVAIHGQLPDQKLAVFIQGNLDHAELRHALMYRAFDEFGQFEGGTNHDWSTEFRHLYSGLKKQAKLAEHRVDSTRVLNTKPALPLTAYVGSYTDPLYGKADITLQNSKLHISFNTIVTGRLDHWHFDTFQLVYDQFWNGTDQVSFMLNAQGKVGKLLWAGAELTKLPEGVAKGVAER
jgi:CubicO group peptidase (beta-lactamase class C family)